MATLEKIRSRASLMIFVIACALLCFIVGDFLNNTMNLFHRKDRVVGEVNGKEIDHEQFEAEYKQLAEIYKYQSREQVEDAIIRNATFENFKQRELLNSEAEADGLSVSPAELESATIGDNPHPVMIRSGFFSNQQGIFDKNIVKAFIDDINRDVNSIQDDNQRAAYLQRIESVRNVWFYTKSTVKQSLMLDKINSMLVNAMSAPKAEADFLASLSSKEVDALVARKYLADLKDEDVQVSDADLKAYYNAHKNDFKGESYRNMQILMFPIRPSEQDLKDEHANMDSLRSQLKNTTDDDRLRLLFESSSERAFQYYSVYQTPSSYDPAFTEFAKTATEGQVSDIVSDQMNGLFKCAKALASPVTRPDSVRISMVAVQNVDSLVAQTRADSIAKAARAGADFAQLAAQHSADKNAAVNGGDQGWVKEGYTGLRDFDNKAFNAPVGSVLVFNNGQVSFVCKVTDRTKPVLKAKIAIMATRMEPSSTTLDSINQVATDFLVENKTADQFVESAKAKGMMLRPLNNLTQNQPTSYVLPHTRGLIKWAFEKNQGAVSDDVYTEVPDQIIIGALTEVVEAEDGYYPFESVKERISKEVIKQKKAEKLAAEMNGKAIAEIGTVDTMKAVNLNTSYLDKIGSEPAVAGALMNAADNSVVVKGRSGVYMVQKIAERENADAFNAENLSRDVRNSVSRSLFNALEDKADIENRSYKMF